MTPADKRLTRGIYKRKNSYWLNVQKDNKRTFISLRTSDLAVAIRKAAQIRHSPQITSGLLLQNCVERFVHAKRLARERGARKGSAWRSAQSKIYTLRMFATFCGKTAPDRVTKDHVKRFYESRLHTLNAQTAYGYYMTVRSFFNWCVAEHLTRENPCIEFKVESPPAAPRKNFCSPELKVNVNHEHLTTERYRYEGSLTVYYGVCDGWVAGLGIPLHWNQCL